MKRIAFALASLSLAPLGNLLAFGSANNAPVASLDAPWRSEFGPLERHLADAAEESVFGVR